MKLSVSEHGKYSPDGSRIVSVTVIAFAGREAGVTVDFETEYLAEHDPQLVAIALRTLATNIEAKFVKKVQD